MVIVCVKNGEVSKSFDDSDHLMVVFVFCVSFFLILFCVSCLLLNFDHGKKDRDKTIGVLVLVVSLLLLLFLPFVWSTTTTTPRLGQVVVNG